MHVKFKKEKYTAMKIEDNLKYTYTRTGFCHILYTVTLEDVGDYKSPTILPIFCSF